MFGRALLLVSIGSLCSWSSQATELKGIQIAGDEVAQIYFDLSGVKHNRPEMQVRENALELTFSESTLGENLFPRTEIPAPHLLVKNIVAFIPKENQVRVRIALNGEYPKLSDKVTLKPDRSGYRLDLRLPLPTGTTLGLMQNEQVPFTISKKEVQNPASKSYFWTIILLVVSFSLVGGIIFWGMRYLNRKGLTVGSRKYLVERLSYVSLGPKVGVALLKVGQEFVLIGVTPHQVSLLSSLPKLQSGYESESAFEREDFKQVVDDELGRLGKRRRGANPPISS